MLSELINSIFRYGELPNKFTSAMGELIRNSRIESGLSQAELAERIYSRQASISAFENGKMEVSSSQLIYLSIALSKPIVAFFPDWISNRVLPSIQTKEEMEFLGLLRKIDHRDRQNLLVQIRALALSSLANEDKGE